MQIISIIFIGILGLIVGSFLNVVILRMNTGKGFGGRSMCLSCSRTLRWYELIPVISFIIQKGTCRHCHSKISVQYPLVECVTALMFAIAAWNIHGIVHLILWLVAISAGMIIAVYDMRHKMIPVQPLIVLAVASLLIGFHVVGALLVALPFLILWFISLGKWIGFGDIEIMAVIGLGLGIGKGFSAVILGFWIACLVMIPTIIYFKKKKKKYNPHIPFGPFLLVGMYIVGMWGINIFTLITKVIQ